MKYVIGLIFFVLAIIGGVIFPDLDLKFSIPGIIAHRSALTYSIILPLLWYHVSNKNTVNRFISMGLFLGIGIHLSFDMFPTAFAGGGLIYFPFLGRFSFLPGEISLLTAQIVTVIWIFINIYWAFKYYFKAIPNKSWISIIGLIAIPLCLYGYSYYYVGQYWLFPALLVGTVGILLLKNRDLKI